MCHPARRTHHGFALARATRKATENTNSPSVENVQAAVANIAQCFADFNS